MSTIRVPHRRTTQVSSMSAVANDLVRLNLGQLTDAVSIQQAILDVLQAVAGNQLELARARLMLYGLRIASTNLKQLNAGAKASAAIAHPTQSDPSETTTKDAASEIGPRVAEQVEAVVSAEDDETAQESCEAADDVAADVATKEQQTIDAASLEEISDDSAATAAPESPDEEEEMTTTPSPRHGEVYVPPSCFASAQKIYQGNARERILHFKQQQRT